MARSGAALNVYRRGPLFSSIFLPLHPLFSLMVCGLLRPSSALLIYDSHLPQLGHLDAASAGLAAADILY